MQRRFKNAGGSIVAYDQGATIESWIPRRLDGGEAPDVLFAGVYADRERHRGAEVHAGIPLCAPWFSFGRAGVEVPSKHGLVRWVDWNFDGVSSPDFQRRGSVYQRSAASEDVVNEQADVQGTQDGIVPNEDVLHNNACNGTTNNIRDHNNDDWTILRWHIDASQLSDMPGAELYPNDMYYSYSLGFGLKENTPRLTASLSITSPTQPTTIDAALHTYFRVRDAREVQISGLRGSAIDDFLMNDHYIIDDTLGFNHRDAIIHFGDGNEPVISLDRGWDRIRITPFGAANAVLWNPGTEIVGAFEGIDDGEWPDFFCVEIGNVREDAYMLEAGNEFTFGFTLELV